MGPLQGSRYSLMAELRFWVALMGVRILLPTFFENLKILKMVTDACVL